MICIIQMTRGSSEYDVQTIYTPQYELTAVLI